MTPQEFVAKWKRVALSERSACQQHFLDLCELLGQPKPAEVDHDGSWYTFERGVTKTEGGKGWADVWMKGHFGWEYKRKHRSLQDAYGQLLRYREDLENPPLLVVCDMDRFEVHTNFTGTIKQVHEFDLDGLARPENLRVLQCVFIDPDSLKPGQTPQAITEKAAEQFGALADGLRERGIAAPAAAHFLMKLMFCMFAEDIHLLPDKLFSKVLSGNQCASSRLARLLKDLFSAMCTGGNFGADEILYFDGGLFADSDVIELTVDEIEVLRKVNEFGWDNVEPSIFGTLFERTLDPTKRAQIGAHYTSQEDIRTLLEPVMMAPLRREWEEVKGRFEKLHKKAQEKVRRDLKAGRGSKGRTKRKKVEPHERLLLDFGARLAHVRVLDPACGSGNFLYVAINLLLDLQKEVITFGANHELSLLPQVEPTQLAGLEINPYAQQLAQVVIWIGYLQWMWHNGFKPPTHPVLKPIESIRNMDAILDLTDPDNPREPKWPDADFVVGNPPFLGGNKIRAGLGDLYVDRLFSLYCGRVAASADLCCYWFEKARAHVQTGSVQRVGLLATQGIRGGVNRDVLKRIQDVGRIFFAESDREWILDGAAVHVSMVGFDNGSETERQLDGILVGDINANLTATADITSARQLADNRDFCCYGSQQKAQFDIAEEIAASMLRAPNAASVANSDVLLPSVNGAQILRRTHQSYVIDFGLEENIEVAARYEAPFEYIKTHIHPVRQQRRENRQKIFWWLHARPSPRYRAAMKRLDRYIVTPVVSKHRLFVWKDGTTLVDHQTVVFAWSDDCHFGVLHSRPHELWARAQGTQVRERESGFRYTPTTCFETFPFPEATDEQREAISAAAKELDRLRCNWLNPPEWTKTEVLEFPGSVDGPWKRYVHDPDERGIGTVRYPRVVAKNEATAEKLQKRTLTNLYNERPTWLDLAHRKLDEAVFAAYGWSPDLSDEELLARLLKLNLKRSGGAS